MIMDFSSYSLIDLVEGIREKRFPAESVRSYFIEKSHAENPHLNAFLTISEPGETLDTNLPLAGVPIGIKDVFCEKGKRTSAGSKMLEHFTPPYEATVIERLRNAGMYSIGKTNMDEFAMGGSGENSAYGPAKNPHDITRIPWGSSSGSAVAVAAGLVPAALGTDTGGSIRQPASMCGIVGFKPSYGRNSRYWVIAMASSLDCPGTFTKTVRDAGLLYEIMGGHDPLDATSLTEDHRIDPKIWERKDLTGIRIWVPHEYFIEGIDAWVRDTIHASIETLRSLGAEIVDISLPHTEYGLAVYYIICPAEVSTNMARYDGVRFWYAKNDPYDRDLTRTEWFGDEVKRRIMIGSFVLSSGFYDAYYKKAASVRELIRRDFDTAFAGVDAIVTPTAPSVAWKIGEKVDDAMKMYLSDIFTIPASLAGLPGLVVPVWTASPSDDPSMALPVWLQILAPRLREETCLMIGHVLEQSMKAKSSDWQHRSL